MKTKIDKSKEQLDKKDRTRDKASTVFLKLYAKRKGKYKGWDSINSEIYQIKAEQTKVEQE